MNPSILNRVRLEKREALNGHRAFALWLTGLPASGKSTLAYALEQALLEESLRSYVLQFVLNHLKLVSHDRTQSG